MMLCLCIFRIQHNMTYLRFLCFVFGNPTIQPLRVVPKYINLFFTQVVQWVISYLIKIDIVYNFADLTLAFKVQQNMTYLMFLLFVFGKPSIHQYRVFSETYLSIFGRQVIEWINQSSKMLIDCCCCFFV